MSRHWLHLDSSPFVIISGAVASLDPGPSGRSSLQRHRSDRQRDEKGLQTRKMAESGRSGRRGLATGVGGSGADSRGIHTSDLPRGDLDHSRGRCRAFRRAFRDRRVSVDFRGSGGFQRGSFGGRRRLRGVGNRGDFERRNKMRRRLSGDVDGAIVATGAESRQFRRVFRQRVSDGGRDGVTELGVSSHESMVCVEERDEGRMGSFACGRAYVVDWESELLRGLSSLFVDTAV